MNIIFSYIQATWWVYAVVLAAILAASTLYLVFREKPAARFGEPIAAGLILAAVTFALIAAPATYAETVTPPPQSTQRYIEA